MRLPAIGRPALVKSRRDRIHSLFSILYSLPHSLPRTRTLSLVVSTHTCLAGCAFSAGDKLRFVPTTAQEATAALAERWELACETEAAEAVSMSPEDLNLVYLDSMAEVRATHSSPAIRFHSRPYR